MTHYHGTPCGGRREDVARFLSGRHALVPFGRSEDIATAAEVCQSFCIDNGAFTAWKQGQPIKDWTPYFEFVRTWCRHPGFDFALIPDVIDGTEQQNKELVAKWCNWSGWKEQIELESSCFYRQIRLCGVPVWHLHESLDYLDYLCRGAFERVALGSSGEWPNPGERKWWDRIAAAMEVACVDGRPRVKLHGLRMLNPAIFSRIPLASADSTNAVQNGARKAEKCGCNTLTGMTILADRIEAHQSADSWEGIDKQGVLVFELGQAG